MPQGLVHDDFLSGFRQDLAHRFKVKAGPGDFGRLDILLQHGAERRDVALGLIDSLESIALGRAYGLVGFTFGLRYDLVIFAIGDIDRVFAVLLCLVYTLKDACTWLGGFTFFNCT